MNLLNFHNIISDLKDALIKKLITKKYFIGNMLDLTFLYLDPGSGSMIFQALIGALVGVAITLKIYWEKIKFKLSSRLHRED